MNTPVSPSNALRLERAVPFFFDDPWGQADPRWQQVCRVLARKAWTPDSITGTHMGDGASVNQLLLSSSCQIFAQEDWPADVQRKVSWERDASSGHWYCTCDIRIPAGWQSEQPLGLYTPLIAGASIDAGAGSDDEAIPYIPYRYRIWVGKAARCQLYWLHACASDVMSSPVQSGPLSGVFGTCEWELEEGSHVQCLEWVYDTETGHNALPVIGAWRHTVRQQARSYFSRLHAQQGMRWWSHDTVVLLLGEYAEAQLWGLYTGAADAHLVARNRVKHLADHTESAQLFKSLLSDKSRLHESSLLHVPKQVRQIKGKAYSHHAVLSPKAHAFACPELAIEADEVWCAHGATTGQWDPQAFFYLMSRGLSEEAAAFALRRAFIANVLPDWLPVVWRDEVCAHA